MNHPFETFRQQVGNAYRTSEGILASLRETSRIENEGNRLLHDAAVRLRLHHLEARSAGQLAVGEGQSPSLEAALEQLRQRVTDLEELELTLPERDRWVQEIQAAEGQLEIAGWRDGCLELLPGVERQIVSGRAEQLRAARLTIAKEREALDQRRTQLSEEIRKMSGEAPNLGTEERALHRDYWKVRQDEINARQNQIGNTAIMSVGIGLLAGMIGSAYGGTADGASVASAGLPALAVGGVMGLIFGALTDTPDVTKAESAQREIRQKFSALQTKHATLQARARELAELASCLGLHKLVEESFFKEFVASAGPQSIGSLETRPESSGLKENSVAPVVVAAVVMVVTPLLGWLVFFGPVLGSSSHPQAYHAAPTHTDGSTSASRQMQAGSRSDSSASRIGSASPSARTARAAQHVANSAQSTRESQAPAVTGSSLAGTQNSSTSATLLRQPSIQAGAWVGKLAADPLRVKLEVRTNGKMTGTVRLVRDGQVQVCQVTGQVMNQKAVTLELEGCDSAGTLVGSLSRDGRSIVGIRKATGTGGAQQWEMTYASE